MPLCLPEPDTIFPLHRPFVVSGWGKTEEGWPGWSLEEFWLQASENFGCGSENFGCKRIC